jgi:hypothetical protein
MVTSASIRFLSVNLLNSFIIRANIINNVNTVAQTILKGLEERIGKPLRSLDIGILRM